MAKSENNEVMFGARGRVGHLVVFKNFGNNQTVIARRPRRVENPVYTAKQLATKLKFREAVVYAQGIGADQNLLAFYQKYAKPGTSAYNMALADFCKSPEIEVLDITAYTGAIGDQIRVRAIDNFAVMVVTVSIFDANDTLLESGFATVAANSVDWFYQATVANGSLMGTKIIADAIDMPGNKTTKTVVI